MMKRIGVVLILIFAFLGISDSAYIAKSEMSNTPLICNVDSIFDCNIVAASQYSHIFGIPLSVFGIIFYSFVFIIAAIELFIFNRLLRRALQAISIIGIIASLYFTFLEIFIIKALCVYCIASAVITLLILISASFIEPIRNIIKYKPPAIPPRPPHFTMPPV